MFWNLVMVLQVAPLGIKLLVIKFLELHVLLLTSDRNDSERLSAEGIVYLILNDLNPLFFLFATWWHVIYWCALGVVLTIAERHFNISWLVSHHPVLDPVTLSSDANRSLGILLELLQSAKNLPGFLTISIVNRWCYTSCSFFFPFLFGLIIFICCIDCLNIWKSNS